MNPHRNHTLLPRLAAPASLWDTRAPPSGPTA